MRHHRDWVPLLATGLLVLVVVVGFAAPWLVPHDPYQQRLTDALLPPLSHGQLGLHVLGTDELGRDTLSRLMLGTRPMLLVAVSSVLLAATVGSAVGLTSGFRGGALDAVLMRVSDIQLSVPPIILAILLAAALSPGITSAIVAITLVTWPQYARVIRAETMRVSTADFVQLARVAGLSRPRILGLHVVPNILSLMVVLATLNLAIAVIISAALSFLGVGVQVPRPDWGNMLAGGTQYLQSWWLVVFPGLAITLTVLALSLAGDHLRDLLDPRVANRGRRDIAIGEAGAQ
ncbi:ABC transporter permease [Pseudonocardia nigra]|uniref:ABC transporter permease n=1 Tax=Pseudonocardia nigra TaxID=1921578 RepID=UPI001C5E6B0F|nr:ABC transporter permease [Pseudonocardia nigra]